MFLIEINKKTTHFTKNLFDTFLSLLKVIIRYKFIPKLPISKLETCVVLGNGPSLKESILTFDSELKRHVLFCVNNFANAEEYKTLKPEFYTMLDPSFWIEKPHVDVVKCFKNIIEKTTWQLKLIVPVEAKKSKFFNELNKKNKLINVLYYNYIVFKGFTKVAHYFFKQQWAAPQSQNVLVVSLFLSLNIGFKKIYLLGADHTWHQNLHVNEKNQLCLKDIHFYEDGKQVNYRLFFKDIHQKETFTMSEIFNTLSKVFYGYDTIKKYSKKCEANIYNASEVSFIDSFEKKKFTI
jgi:Protein of unknown function DUF115